MNRLRRPYRPAGWLVSSILSALLASAATPAPSPAPDAPPADPLPVPEPTAVDREPYTRWKAHVGTPSDAVVHVRVTLKDASTGETQVREGSGLVVRCDGFVLAPARLLWPGMTLSTGEVRPVPLKDKVALLTFAAADGQTPPPQPVPHPRYYERHPDFALVKVNDQHLKGLPMLAPKNVHEGMALQVVYARPRKDRPGTAEAVAVTAIAGKPEKGGAHFSFAGGGPRVPPGAVVVDAASGLAVGIVPGAAPAGAAPPPAPAFATFAGFHRISNAVALLPDPGAHERSGRVAPGQERDGMVWVPGGPTVLTDKMAAQYAALYGKWIACTPGFWIDKHEVTNGQYREFLAATEHPRLPAGWDRTELGSPRRAPDVPVTGVGPEDAAAFADWCGKRLVTPVEWLHARHGALGASWLAEYQHGLREVSLEIKRRFREKSEIEALERMLTEEEWRRRGVNVRGARFAETDTVRQAREDFARAVGGLIERFDRHFDYPYLVAPVGIRQKDVSAYGVRDVATNVPELLLPNLSYRPVELAPKLFVARYDPDGTPRGTEVRIVDPFLLKEFADPVTRRLLNSPARNQNPLFRRVFGLAGGFKDPSRGTNGQPIEVPFAGYSDDALLSLQGQRGLIEALQIPVLGNGFRCAR